MARYLLDDGVDAARLSQLRFGRCLPDPPDRPRTDSARPAQGRPERAARACSARRARPRRRPRHLLRGDRPARGSVRRSRSSTSLRSGSSSGWRSSTGAGSGRASGRAVALSLVGCFFVVRAYDAGSLDPAGVVAAFGAMLTFGIYMVGPSGRAQARAGHHAVLGLRVREPVLGARHTWWSFPFEGLASTRNALLAAAIVVRGTLVPFILMVAALRHIAAPRAAVVATLEPVLAAVFAWVIHTTRRSPRCRSGRYRRCSPRSPGCSRGAPITRPRRPLKLACGEIFSR